jgi:hypothetical protein
MAAAGFILFALQKYQKEKQEAFLGEAKIM